MSPASDATKLLDHFVACDLSPMNSERGWRHMGAVITDAALQVRSNYRATVLPRVQDLQRRWPDADTTAGFKARLETEDLAALLRWRGPRKLKKIHDLTDAMADLGIETTDELRSGLENPHARAATRARLFAVHQVGRKTVGYLAILAGSSDEVAIDAHVRTFAAEAGVSRSSDHALSQAIKAAARTRGWSPGSMDAAIWNHMSSPQS